MPERPRTLAVWFKKSCGVLSVEMFDRQATAIFPESRGEW